jgi:hypothetical protein
MYDMKIYFERKKGQITFYETPFKYGPPLKFRTVIKDCEWPREVYLKWEEGIKRELVSSGVERNRVCRFPYFKIDKVEWAIYGREIQYRIYRTDYRGEYSTFKYRGNKRSMCPKRMFQYRRPGLGRVIEKADHRGYFWI